MYRSILRIYEGDDGARGRVVLDKQWNPDHEKYEINVDLGEFPSEPMNGFELTVDEVLDTEKIPIITKDELYLYNPDINNKFLALGCSWRYRFIDKRRDPYALSPCLITLDDESMILGFKNYGRTYYFEPPYSNQPRTSYDTFNPHPTITLKEMNNGPMAFRVQSLTDDLYCIKLDDQRVILAESDAASLAYPTYSTLNF